MGQAKFLSWKKRYGKPNEHNGKIPKDFWILPEEEQAIIDFFIENPTEGYRRLSYMMMDENVAYVSASTVLRVLKKHNMIERSTAKKSKKGTGFVQPLSPHKHWHTDITYINLSGTFYYMCSVLDGYSRSILHWDICESMKEDQVELIIQKALEKYPGNAPRLISDNGPQFLAKDFKEFIRNCGMSHVRTAPYYPQSNGKQERMQGTIKQECIRERCPQTLEQAKRWVGEYIDYYNRERLHSAHGYIAPFDMLEGREKEIFSRRDSQLSQARQQRREKRRLQVQEDFERVVLSDETEVGSAGAQPAQGYSDQTHQTMPDGCVSYSDLCAHR